MSDHTATGETSRKLVEQYIEFVRAGNTEGILAMYADDGVLEPPDRSTALEIRGADALRAHYSKSVQHQSVKVNAVNWVVDGLKCVVELRSILEGDPTDRRVVDVFTFNDEGRIAHMTAYRR